MGSAFKRTEAAGSADFRLLATGPSGAEISTGSVNFAQPALSLVRRADGVGTMATSEQVREIGLTEYDQVPRVLGCWSRSRKRQPLSAISIFEDLPSAGKVTTAGKVNISGVTTTEYVVHVPGATGGGVQVAPHTLHLWLDRSGRIRRESMAETETGAAGGRGPAAFTWSLSFSHFGTPVHVSVPAGCTP